MNQKLSFQDIIKYTNEVAVEIEKKESKPWSPEIIFIELTKKVGDLASRIMMFEKYYTKDRLDDPKYFTNKEKLADELGDIMLMVMRIAKKYDLNMEKSYMDMLRDTMKWLGKNPNF